MASCAVYNVALAAQNGKASSIESLASGQGDAELKLPTFDEEEARIAKRIHFQKLSSNYKHTGTDSTRYIEQLGQDEEAMRLLDEETTTKPRPLATQKGFGSTAASLNSLPNTALPWQHAVFTLFGLTLNIVDLVTDVLLIIACRAYARRPGSPGKGILALALELECPGALAGVNHALEPWREKQYALAAFTCALAAFTCKKKKLYIGIYCCSGKHCVYIHLFVCVCECFSFYAALLMRKPNDLQIIRDEIHTRTYSEVSIFKK